MAEMAVAAFTAIGSAVSSAAAALPAMSTVASVLSGVATAGSVIMGVQQSRQTRVAGEAAFLEGRINAEAATLEGERAATQSAARAVEIRREAVRKLAAARVAFAGSGLDVDSGQLLSIERSMDREADYAAGMDESNARIAQSEAGLSASRYRARGENARVAAKQKAEMETVGAGVTGLRGLVSIARRG